jgi:riboflavin kinase/FMN adenylyltransferase
LETVVNPEQTPGNQRVIAAIGAFDGLHRGHKELFKTALKIKDKTGLPVVAVTFQPHPKSLIKSCREYTALLTTEQEKKMLLENMGIDYFWAIPFTVDVSRLSPREFIRHYLCTLVRAQHLVCGFNFTFGYRGQGTPKFLEEIGVDMGFKVTVVPPFTVHGELVSSTRIRQLLADGRVDEVIDLLGRPYCVFGEVVRGDGIGRQMGTPTSNIDFPCDKLLPTAGVYAVFVRDKGSEVRPAVANVGVRPTFGGSRTRVEVHIPGFSGELYGGSMQVFFMKYIRGERKFSSRELLRNQIEADIKTALSVLGPLGVEFPGRDSFTLIGAYDRISHANLP